LLIDGLCAVTLAAADYQFIKRKVTAACVRRPGVDLAAISVYCASRNMVFGFNLLTRCRLWAATQVISPKLGLLPPAPRGAGVQQKA